MARVGRSRGGDREWTRTTAAVSVTADSLRLVLSARRTTRLSLTHSVPETEPSGCDDVPAEMWRKMKPALTLSFRVATRWDADSGWCGLARTMDGTSRYREVLYVRFHPPLVQIETGTAPWSGAILLSAAQTFLRGAHSQRVHRNYQRGDRADPTSTHSEELTSKF